MPICSKFGNCNFNWWWVMACTNSKWGTFWLWSSIWPWKSQSIVPQNNRDLNQGLLHLWSKFGDPSLNRSWVIARTNLVTDGLTDRRRQRQFPKAKTASGKKGMCSFSWFQQQYIYFPSSFPCDKSLKAAVSHTWPTWKWAVSYMMNSAISCQPWTPIGGTGLVSSAVKA